MCIIQAFFSLSPKELEPATNEKRMTLGYYETRWSAYCGFPLTWMLCESYVFTNSDWSSQKFLVWRCQKSCQQSAPSKIQHACFKTNATEHIMNCNRNQVYGWQEVYSQLNVMKRTELLKDWQTWWPYLTKMTNKRLHNLLTTALP